jgi:hypothetical protein
MAALLSDISRWADGSIFSSWALNQRMEGEVMSYELTHIYSTCSSCAL